MKYSSCLCMNFLSGCSCFISPYDTLQLHTKKDISPCHTHTHTNTYTLPKAKQMSHQARISPKFSNSQNRKHEAKLSLHRSTHTHHFHFDSVFLTYGFLSPPASPPLHISNLSRYNKLNLNTISAADTKGRLETQKQSLGVKRQSKNRFPRLR